MPTRVSVVIPARNEEKFIGTTLHSLLIEQTVKPTRVIVVDDGSQDNTSQVASSFGTEVVRLPDRGYQIQGTPILADVMNYGLQRLNNYGVGETDNDYVMILGADHLLPPNYISTIITEMENDKNIAICSGIIEGEEKKNLVPRGSGRIVRANFWKKIGLHYPVKFGFEAFLAVKALQMGYTNVVFDHLVATTQRKTGQNYGKNTYVGYGKGLKALGYSRLYVAGKIGLIFPNNPKKAIYMLKGYFSDVEIYDKEFREYIRKMQHKQIKQYLLHPRLLS
jgi:glycosyltransferase involved in cell wall biosynthesis